MILNIGLWSKRLTPVSFYLQDIQGLRTHYWLYPKRARELRFINHLGERFICKFTFKWHYNQLIVTPLKRCRPRPLERNRKTPMTWKDVQETYSEKKFFGLITKQTGFIIDYFKTL